MDTVLYWNDIALEANRTTHTTGEPREAVTQGPTGSARALAIVHLAIHDAYFGINPGHECYLGSGLPEAGAGADHDAAISAAAHATLSALYPTQKAYFDAAHAAAGLAQVPGRAAGHTFGSKVAARILALRAGDPGRGDDGYAASHAFGTHQKDPDSSAESYDAPFYGAGAHCFAVTRRHHLDAPPQPGSEEYLRALRQVRAKGIAPQLMGTLPADLREQARTAEETVIGQFWGYDGAKGLGTPPRLYNQIVRKIAEVRRNDTAANARLFALLNVAMADAGILAWHDKYFYDMWRPVRGVRDHRTVGGSGCTDGEVLPAEADTEWLPLGAPNTNNPGTKNTSPNFPAYPSGHATFGAAALQSVRRFYGQGAWGADNLADGIEFISDELDGVSTDNTGTVRSKVVRTFPGGMWQMIEENGRSRVYLGVHWEFDAFAADAQGRIDLGRNIGGVRLGLDIADDIATHGMRAAAAAGPAAS